MPSLGGFFKGLGKRALQFGGLAAAPPTGGATLLPSILSAAGSVAGGALAGRAAGRQAEAGINLNQDQLRLLGARLNLSAPQQRAQNAARGDLLANLQDVNVGAPRGTRLSGGTRPSLLSGNTRNLGRQMSRDALLSQMRGDPFTPTPLPQSGKLDTLLAILGGVGTGLGAINAARPPTPTQPNLTLPGRPDPFGIGRPLNAQNPFRNVRF